MIRFAFGSTALLASLGIAGSTSTARQESIKIACLAPLTGDNKPWGDDQLAGCKMAIAEVNSAGGIDGRPIELVQADTASRPDQALYAAQKVAEQKVVAMVGEVSSGNTIQIGKVAAEFGIPVVACGATRTDLTENRNIFRVTFTDDVQGPAIAKFAFDKLKFKRIATFSDDALPYSITLNDDFTKGFTRLGGKIVSRQKYESGGRAAPNYDRVLKAIAKTNPDAIYMSGYFTEVGTIAKRARALGIKATFLGGDGWDSDTILADSGGKIVGGYFCSHYVADDPRPESRLFVEKWRKSHGGRAPRTIAAALAYDAMMLTIDAVKRSGTAEPKEIMSALEETVGFKASTGDISLKGMRGNPPKRVIIVKITAMKQGSWQTFAGEVSPSEYR